MRASRNLFRVSVLILAVSAIATGCSRPTRIDMGGEEGIAVASALESLNDYKANDQQIAAAYLNASSAPKSDELNRYVFYIVGKPTVDGNKAKSKVLVENNDGTKVGEFEWSFEKANGAWKVENAPLR
jgi:hypothetical protein